MTTQSYQLVMRVGPSPGKVFTLSQNEMFIGRDISNEVVVNDAEISRRHSRLTVHSGGYTIEDLGSTNGTFVNGQRIAGQQLLEPGQTIRLGENVTFSYELAGFDPDATIASGQEQAAPARTAPPAAPAKPAAPPQPAAPAAPARSKAAGAGLAGLTGNRNVMIGCGVVLVIGVCALSAYLFFAPCEFWQNYLGFMFSGTC
ncbi:MAG: FHA domain-containing protein [Anaerolineae bacterium]|nr:FHA domain-containing protein [Anaerolineae bacterium]